MALGGGESSPLPWGRLGDSMPIISTHQKMGEGLIGIKNVNDKTIYTHAYKVDDIALNCKELRKDPNNGFSKDRGFRLIARIPFAAFLEKKELTNDDGTVNVKAMKKYLKSPEGEIFRAVDKGF